jgi:hypothetical protein
MKYLSLFESYVNYHNKDLVIIDIQPEYENVFSFDISEFTAFLNENINNFSSVTILYNGYDTLGMINEYDYKEWLLENGLEEENLNGITFYDKGYAFFRYCMDSDIDHDLTTALVKWMYNNNINDSRDIDSDIWDTIEQELEGVSTQDIRSLLENSGDMINIPDLMDELKHLNNIVITGGGLEECLKEVEIALNALEKEYDILHNFTY